MIDASILASAVQALAQAAPRAEQIVLFGSAARGDAAEGSDLDFLVIERCVENRAHEMVRLRRALRPLRMPADVLVCSREEVNRWDSSRAQPFTGHCVKDAWSMADPGALKSLGAAEQVLAWAEMHVGQPGQGPHA